MSLLTPLRAQQETGTTKTVGTPTTGAATATGKAKTKPFSTSRYSASEPTTGAGFEGHITDFVEDQKQIWTSPSRIRLSDANWLVPLGGFTAGLFVTDRQYSASVNQNPTTLKHYKTVSDVGIASLIGGGAGLYLLSFPTHNSRWHETGLLAGEAALNSLVTVEALKYSVGRERPYQGTGNGVFFHRGTSFPSEHAAAAWSIAGVFAHEYPGTVPSLFAYGIASAVSLSRVQSRQHFPSDVLVGSVLGYLISQNVFRRHHDPELGGSAWESPGEFVVDEKVRTPSFMGSPYVPLDSWIYPAFERLAALGYVKSASLGIRPWSRMECARLLSEAGESQFETNVPSEVEELFTALSRELTHESDLVGGESNRDAHLESVYVRTLGISGTPLTDNYHFGQTVLNDYGRPYQEGMNSVAGVSGWTTAGPFVIYARGEYQSSPSAPALSQTALNFISNTDGLPPNPPSIPFASISRFQLLDAYVGVNLANWQISYGRRSFWWGPGQSGAMLYTNNAAPLNNTFTVDRVSPFQLPGFLQFLGNIRFQAFIGQLSGQEFLSPTFSGTTGATIGQYGSPLKRQPFLSGEKISFKFNENFELNLSKTTIYGGPGLPLTPNTLLKSTLGLHIHGDPLGDGRSGLDFSYRVPKLREWLSVYGDAMSEDEVSPLSNPGHAIFQGGLYFAKVPKIPKLDLRLEGGFTGAVNYKAAPAGYFYTNSQYLDGYTNNGQLIGTWLGRAAQGETVQTNYWISARSRIGLELRHRKIDQKFIPQGGTQNDVAVNADIFSRQGFRFTGNVQYERWDIPLLAMNRQSNVAASFEFGFWPVRHH